MSTHNLKNLIDHILPMSRSNHFAVAVTEWKLIDIQISEQLEHCPCGVAIRELCFIRNHLTGKQTWVGNVCVNRFMGIKTSALFAGLKRIAADHFANVNDALLAHVYSKGYIFEGEYDFLLSTRRKRRLSNRQLQWKQKINRRILNQIVVQRMQMNRPQVQVDDTAGWEPLSNH